MSKYQTLVISITGNAGSEATSCDSIWNLRYKSVASKNWISTNDLIVHEKVDGVDKATVDYWRVSNSVERAAQNGSITGKFSDRLAYVKAHCKVIGFFTDTSYNEVSVNPLSAENKQMFNSIEEAYSLCGRVKSGRGSNKVQTIMVTGTDNKMQKLSEALAALANEVIEEEEVEEDIDDILDEEIA